MRVESGAHFPYMQARISSHRLTEKRVVVTFISTSYWRIPIIDSTPRTTFKKISEFCFLPSLSLVHHIPCHGSPVMVASVHQQNQNSRRVLVSYG
jgi:hypothetical protein